MSVLSRIPRDGAAIAVVALAIGTVGGAVAAEKITSDDIANRTIQAKDQATDSTNGRIVENGSLGRQELSNGAKMSFILPARVPSGGTIRGAVGGDFHAYDAGSDDFGVDVSLPIPASSGLTDDDVHVVVSTWQNGGGQSQPSTTDGNAGCTGSVANPTAPAGDVCIYVTGGDNAENVTGYTVAFGSEATRYGFKLKWDPAIAGDTFIDAVWAYRAG
jgi:hypothetical protein